VGRAFLIIWPPSQIRDLPIPSTFAQTALGAVAAAPVAGAVGVIGGPVFLLRRRGRRRRDQEQTRLRS
jgi:hypothetical protein